MGTGALAGAPREDMTMRISGFTAVALAGAVAAALPACCVEVAVITAGLTDPFELMFARMSVEKPESSSAIRLFRLCSQL